MKLRGILHFIAKVGRPVLALLGVKKGTLAEKAEGVVEAVDEALPADGSAKK